MNKYMVSFDVVTPGVTVDELSRQLNLPPGRGSRNAGTTLPGRKRAEKKTVFRFESALDEERALDDHIENVLARVPLESLGTLVLPNEAQLWLNVGVIFPGLLCSIAVSPHHMSILGEYGISLEITTYVATDET